MEEGLKYLEEHCSITMGDLVTMQLEDLTILVKIVQLETLMDFLKMNSPEELGLIHSLEFELKGILDEQLRKEETQEPDQIQF